MQKLKLKKEYQKYPEYKPARNASHSDANGNSEIDWIGQIPKEWEIKKIRHIGRLIGSTVDKKIDKNDKMINLVNYKDVYNSNKITSNIDFMRVSATVGQLIKNQVEIGDVLFTPSSETIEDIGHSSVVVDKLPDTLFSYHLVKLKFLQDINNDYKKYLFNNDIVLNQFSSFAMGITRMVLSRDDFCKTNIILANKKEQEKIAKFLDEKVDLIDEIVKKKKKLIELLKEKRTAIINQAVTKGLDLNVEMKNSGVEWIGEIPKDWKIKKLKFVANIKTSNVDKKSEPNEKKIMLCNYVDVYKNNFITSKINFMKATATNDQIKKFSIKKSDVLITKDSESPDDIAIPALVNEDLDGVLCGYHLSILRSKENIIKGDYLFRVMQSKKVNTQFVVAANGITRFGLGAYPIKNALILIPPSNEQNQIIELISKKDIFIDQAMDRIKESINLLNEFKSSLISNVVTGKVKI